MERTSRSKTRGPVPEHRPLPDLRLRPIHASRDGTSLPGRLMAAPAGSGGDPQRPSLERREANGAGQHHVGRLEQRRAHHGVADLADPAGPIDLAGLVLLRRQAKVSTHRLGPGETLGWLMADRKVIATTAPTPEMVIRRAHTSSSRTVLRSSRCSVAYSAHSVA